LPVSHWSDGMPSKADRSAGARDAAGAPSSDFMVRLIFPPNTSTERIRTCTSSPSLTSSFTSSTKPSLMAVMCTRPSAMASLSGAVTVTNAPNGAVRATLPVSHWSDGMPSNADRSAGGRAAAGAPPKPLFMESDILPRSKSTFTMRTFTSWPTSTSAYTSSTKPSLICDMWTRPLALALPSGSVTVTNAPKSRTLSTVPESHSSGSTASKEVRSAGRRPPPPPIFPSTIVSPNFPSSLISLTHTSTSWPTST